MAEVIILALDLATVTGFVRTNPQSDRPIGWSVRLRDKGTPIVHASRKLGPMLSELIRLHQVDLVAYEAPLPAGAARKHEQTGTSELLHGLAHCVEAITACWQVRCVSIHQQTWRKHFLGTARPDDPKGDCKRLCRTLGWWEAGDWDDNTADAAGVWAWATGTFAGKAAAVQMAGPLFSGA